jgi:hypothetical protein
LALVEEQPVASHSHTDVAQLSLPPIMGGSLGALRISPNFLSSHTRLSQTLLLSYQISRIYSRFKHDHLREVVFAGSVTFRRHRSSYARHSVSVLAQYPKMPSNEGTSYVAPWRVLIVGGSYAGLAAATNLLDLSEGRVPRFNPSLERDTKLGYRIPVEITIVDERDGYCECYLKRQQCQTNLLKTISSARLWLWQMKHMQRKLGSNSRILQP